MCFQKSKLGSDQDGRVDKLCTCSHKDIKIKATEQPWLGATWSWAEHKSYNWGLIEEATSKLVGGVEMQNGLFPHQHVEVENQEIYLGYGGLPWRVRISSLTPGSPNQSFSVKKRGIHNFWLWNHRYSF